MLVEVLTDEFHSKKMKMMMPGRKTADADQFHVGSKTMAQNSAVQLHACDLPVDNAPRLWPYNSILMDHAHPIERPDVIHHERIQH